MAQRAATFLPMAAAVIVFAIALSWGSSFVSATPVSMLVVQRRLEVGRIGNEGQPLKAADREPRSRASRPLNSNRQARPMRGLKMKQHRAILVVTATIAAGVVFPMTAIAGITVIPPVPHPGVPFQIEVQSWCGSGGVTILDTSIDIHESAIVLSALIECGPWAQATPYTSTFDIPPQSSGSYTVEFWQEEDSLTGPILMYTGDFQVLATPVPTQNEWGVIILAAAIAIIAARRLAS